jgi:DNA-binding NarL/FixJ family response regulator
VEDHISVRQLLETFVAYLPGFVVTGVSEEDGPALAAARRHEVDIVILDLMIPGDGGMNTLQRLMQLPQPPRVVIYSATVTVHSLKLAMAHGAYGYVDKSDSIEDLRTALQRVQAGGVHFSQRASQLLTTLLAPVSRENNEQERLELRVLELLARGATIKEAAHELKVSAQRVYRIRQLVMERAHARNAQDLIRYAIEVGLVGAYRAETSSWPAPGNSSKSVGGT